MMARRVSASRNTSDFTLNKLATGVGALLVNRNIRPKPEARMSKIFMVRCVKCRAENWAPAVASGQCAWCGYEANEEDVKKENNPNMIWISKQEDDNGKTK